jgi:Leucine-rich repeat (LRR) protein
LSDEILDEYLSPELKPKNAKEKIVDYQTLTHFIKSHFPISKTDFILKAVESLKDQTSNNTQFNKYVSKLSNDDIDLLFEGIKASTLYK